MNKKTASLLLTLLAAVLLALPGRALQEGPYRLPPMESDGLLTVTLRPGTAQPVTGDTGAALYVLCASLAAGALLTLGRSRKKHL